MIWLEKITITLAIFAFTSYLIQILMIIGCCDKHINLQVNVFRFTTITMVLTLIGFITLLIAK